jgi:crotonobetainyl-CoA:carnitine CoA-transferase CaiB-like acyl-CoA transferase
LNRFQNLAYDSHLRVQEAVPEEDGPEKGNVPVPGVFPKTAPFPGRIEHLGAKLEECNQEIYGNFLGLSAKQIEALKDKRII